LKRVLSVFLVVLLVSTPVFAQSFVSERDFRSMFEQASRLYKLGDEAAFYRLMANNELTFKQRYAVQLSQVLHDNDMITLIDDASFNMLILLAGELEKDFNFEFIEPTDGWIEGSTLTPLVMFAMLMHIVEIEGTSDMFQFIIDRYEEHENKYGERLILLYDKGIEDMRAMKIMSQLKGI